MPRITESGRPQQRACDADDESHGDAVECARPQEAAHAKAHLAKDVDDQLVVRLGEQVDGECLEAVAAHQPEKTHNEYEHEVDDEAEQRASNRDEDLLRRVDDTAELLADVDVEVKLLLDPGKPVEKVLLVRGEIGGE